MINKNHASEIRTCERIKFDQALYILTMYEKKIRKNRQAIYKQNQNHQKSIDADQQLQDITYAWKNKWKMDLTKPILNCVTSVYPRILMDFTHQSNQKLERFYFTMGKFIKRMRAQHEDQTNFKFVLNFYDKTTMIGGLNEKQSNKMQHQSFENDQRSIKDNLKYLNSSKSAVNSLLQIFYNLSNNMIITFQKNYQLILNQDICDVDTQSLQWQIIRPLRFIRQITRRSIKINENLTNDLSIQSQEATQLVIFVNNVLKIMEKVKESQHGATLINVIPQVKQLTYVVHPLLVAIYANFKKEILEKQPNFNWRESVPVQTKMFMDITKNSYNYSKVVFINLDGYQSQFNLELARNFKKHLMYISFPKQPAVLNDFQKVYSKRFLKKLMLSYSQAWSQGYPQQKLSQQLLQISRLQQLNFNPQCYHRHVSCLYPISQKACSQSANQNLFIFPIRYQQLQQTFSQQFLQSQFDIEQFQSHFIRFIMKDFIINQIREFHPSMVIISHSGRIHIKHEHFVQIIQELTKVSNYKLIMWNNLTTALCHEQHMQIDDVDGNQCDYDNTIIDHKISDLLNIKIDFNNYNNYQFEQHKDKQKPTLPKVTQMVSQQQQASFHSQSNIPCIQLFNLIARFLKISSGTYNLSIPIQQQSLVQKYKTQFILAYIDQLMSCLGKEYPTIDRIRFRNKDLAIIPKLFQENFNSIKKAFTKTVPQFYSDLYKVIEAFLFNITSTINTQLFKNYKVQPSYYQHDIQELWGQLTKSSSIQINSLQMDSNNRNSQQSLSSQKSIQYKMQKKDIASQLEQIKIKKNKNKFEALKQLHFIQISTQKFDQKASIYIKKSLQKKQFQQISEQSQQTQGLYDVYFLRKDKSTLKLFQSTKLHYKTCQVNRSSQSIPILILNNLSDQKPCYFQNYISLLQINDQINKERKNIEEKKALAVPILMKNNEMVVDSKTFIVRTEWNFIQTTTYLILYWPVQFDFIKATIYKMLNRNYAPKILDQIYIASKTERHIFNKVRNTFSETIVLPRMGCSSYEFQSRLFIFGGFYDQQRNYLDFQHDITMLDLQTYEQSNGQKMQIQNLKGTLYSQQNFINQVQQTQKYNSLIRPKLEYEIFSKQQLADWYQPNTDYHEAILIGGYGQNFIRPFSMITYYYYQIKFSYQNRSILSIQKKIIYDKTVPINVRQLTKNMGIIKTNKKNPNTNILQTNKITQPSSFLTFRNCFRLQKGPDSTQQLKYKFRYMFAEDENKSYKTEIKRVQEQRTEEFDSSTIGVEKMDGNNHLISLEKDGKKCVISLHLEIPHQKAKKLGCSREVKLTHQSIFYIDFWNSMICAVVKHDFYTKGKSVLVQYNIKSLENLSFKHDQIPHIALTWIKQFDINLSMHILIACNKNTIAILHGQKLMNTQKVKEFIVKKKKNKTQAVAYEIQQRNISELSNLRIENCYCVFFKQRNKILCLQYLSESQSSTIIQMSHQIQLNSANDIYLWSPSLQKAFVSLRYYKIQLQSIIIPLHKLTFCQYLRLQKDQYEKTKLPIQRIIQVLYNKKKYYLELGCLKANYNMEVQVLQMIRVEQVKIDKDNIDKGTILNKKIEHYYDIQQQ